MVNESGNADASVGEEATLSAAVESLCARRCRCRARLGRGARLALRGEYACHRARRGRVDSCIGGLCYSPRPFSVCHPHGYHTRFSFDAYHRRRPSSAYHRR